jgi:Tol biopolymer transport system component
VYVVDEAGGQLRQIPGRTGFSDQIPSWSRDGRSIYFGSNRTGRYEIWRAPAVGGDAQQVTTTTCGSVPFESWDGQTLIYSRVVEGVRFLYGRPVLGGPERQLVATAPYWNYVPGPDGLYFVTTPEGQRAPFKSEVRLLDLASGNSRVIGSVRLASISPGLSVHPDGKTVIVSGIAEITQDLMRIDNFRYGLDVGGPEGGPFIVLERRTVTPSGSAPVADLSDVPPISSRSS